MKYYRQRYFVFSLCPPEARQDKCFSFYFFSLLGIKLHSSCHRPLHSFIEAPLWERHKSRLLWRESARQRVDMGQNAHRQLPLLQEEQSNLRHKRPIWRAGNITANVFILTTHRINPYFSLFKWPEGKIQLACSQLFRASMWHLETTSVL